MKTMQDVGQEMAKKQAKTHRQTDLKHDGAIILLTFDYKQKAAATTTVTATTNRNYLQTLIGVV